MNVSTPPAKPASGVYRTRFGFSLPGGGPPSRAVRRLPHRDDVVAAGADVVARGVEDHGLAGPDGDRVVDRDDAALGEVLDVDGDRRGVDDLAAGAQAVDEGVPAGEAVDRPVDDGPGRAELERRTRRPVGLAVPLAGAVTISTVTSPSPAPGRTSFASTSTTWPGWPSNARCVTAWSSAADRSAGGRTVTVTVAVARTLPSRTSS